MAIDFKRGRPTSMTPEKREAIVAAVRRNAPHAVAAWHAKVCTRTFYYWMEKGAEDQENEIDSEFAKFNYDVLSAEADKILEHLDKLDTAQKGWKASLKLLERRWSQFFGVGAYLHQDLADRAAKIEEKLEKLSQFQGDVNG